MKGKGSSASHLSTYSKTLALKTQTAEDKVTDDNYSNGLISTESYLSSLQDRSVRVNLTPLQRTNLTIKIRDVQSTYQDEQVQTAYQTGGFINGQKVDDAYMVAYEKQKLDVMDTNSTAYEQQNQKVIGLQDKLEKKNRADMRLQTELSIAQTPDYDFNTMRKKQQMYEDLAKQAQEDGDATAYQKYTLSAINYKKSADNAELSYQHNQNMNKIKNEGAVATTDIKYGAQSGTSSTPASGVNTPAGTSIGENASAPVDSTPIQNPDGSVTPGEPAPIENTTQNPTSLVDPDNIDSSNLEQYYNDKEKATLDGIDTSVASKEKQITLTQQRIDSSKRAYDEYMAYATQLSDAGEWDKSSTQAQFATDELNKRNDLMNQKTQQETELQDFSTTVVEKIDNLNKDVSYRLVTDWQDYLDLQKATADADFMTGKISKVDWREKTGLYNTNKSHYLETTKSIADNYKDKKVSIDTQQKIEALRPIVKEDEVVIDNPQIGECVLDPLSGSISEKNVRQDKITKDSTGTSAFSKLYAPAGNFDCYTPVSYFTVNDKGQFEPMTSAAVATTPLSILQDSSHVKGITEVGQDGKIITNIIGKDNKVIETRDSVGNVIYKAPVTAKSDGFIQKAWDWFSNGIKNTLPGLNIPGLNVGALRSQNGQPTAQGSDLRSMGNPFGIQKVSADYSPSSSQLSNVPEEYSQMIMDAANKYGVSASLIAGALEQESNFDPAADNGKDRGIAQINRVAHPEITDAQAFDPKFSIDFIGKEFSRLTKSMGSEYDAVRAYNAGESGALNDPLAGKQHADLVYTKEKNHALTTPGTQPVSANVNGLRSQNPITNATSISGPLMNPSLPNISSNPTQGLTNILRSTTSGSSQSKPKESKPKSTPTLTKTGNVTVSPKPTVSANKLTNPAKTSAIPAVSGVKINLGPAPKVNFVQGVPKVSNPVTPPKKQNIIQKAGSWLKSLLKIK